MRMRFEAAGRVCGFRDYLSGGFGGNHVAVFQHFDTSLLDRAYTFAERVPSSSNGWTQVWVRPWLRIVPGDWYWLWVLHFQGQYYRNNTAIPVGGAVTHGDISMLAGAQSTGIAPFYATNTENRNVNAIDVLFQAD
jgi:hypothetical protein